MTASSSSALFITARCQNRCRFCFEWAAQPRGYEMGWETLEAAMDTLVARGSERVDLVGGEPFLHPRFEELVALARERGLKVTVTTNGLRLADPDFARRVLPRLDALVVSLHGGDEESYGALTRNPDGFRALRRALTVLRDRPEEMSLLFNTTLARPSVGRLPAILRLVSPLAPVSWHVTNPFPVGAAVADYASLAPRLAAVARATPRLVSAAQARGVDVRFSFFPACAIGYRTDLNNDRSEPDHARGYAVDRELNPAHELDLTFERSFGARCERCDLQGAGLCYGVPTPYLTRYGDGELRPIRRQDHARLLRLFE